MNPSLISFAVMMALAKGDMHRYGIVKQIEHDAQGNYSLQERAIYRAVDRLAVAGHVQALPGSNEELRQFALTRRGRRVLQWEFARMGAAMEILRERVG